MNNNIHDKMFVCPCCHNKTLVPVNGNEDIVGIGYHDLCVCEECAAELYAVPQYDCSVEFITKEKMEENHDKW